MRTAYTEGLKKPHPPCFYLDLLDIGCASVFHRNIEYHSSTWFLLMAELRVCAQIDQIIDPLIQQVLPDHVLFARHHARHFYRRMIKHSRTLPTQPLASRAGLGRSFWKRPDNKSFRLHRLASLSSKHRVPGLTPGLETNRSRWDNCSFLPLTAHFYHLHHHLQPSGTFT